MGTLGSTLGGLPFWMAIWKAHSVYNKRPEIEELLHTQRLDVLCVTESSLTPEDIWEVPRFMSYRADRFHGQGGGVLILVSRGMIFFCGDFNAHHISWGCSHSTL